jgi:archaetidylinositol phosphate synthase
VSRLLSKTDHLPARDASSPRPWDARLARRLVAPLKNTHISPNHLTSVRLVIGLAAAAAFLPGTYGWSNLGALLLILSNFLDHTDGELARISGKSSQVGHWYDLGSDAAVTILLFVGIGAGVGRNAHSVLQMPPIACGTLAGVAVALTFYLRMRIESLAGKAAAKQASLGGFETEDVLYLLPLVTLFDGLEPFLIAASIGAPLFAIWVVFDYRRVVRGRRSGLPASTVG